MGEQLNQEEQWRQRAHEAECLLKEVVKMRSIQQRLAAGKEHVSYAEVRLLNSRESEIWSRASAFIERYADSKEGSQTQEQLKGADSED